MPQLDPLDFLKLARELGHDSDEAHLRTAVGRAYYALFLIARTKTGTRGTNKVHTRVIEAVRKRKEYKSIGSYLDSLRRLRTVADYELIPVEPSDRNWANNWSTADALVKRILLKLPSW